MINRKKVFQAVHSLWYNNSMLYKFFNKKGNITVVLIGLISVMLLMTLALSKRMTGHTQLLTLGDYTQISRYFLESYVSHVLQQVKEQVNDPTSELSKTICESIDESFTGKDITDVFVYKKSSELEDLTTIYGPNNKITRKAPILKLTGLTEKLGYPKWLKMTNPDKEGVEKKGYLEVTCECSFNKRNYTLVVQFPFTVVFRMTPVIKDFMLFVDNIYEEQKWNPLTVNYNTDDITDKLNLLSVKDGLLETTIDEIFRKNAWSLRADSKFRPMILTADTNLDEKTSGMVYFGPTDTSFTKSIFLNLTGISPESNSAATINRNFDNGEIHLVSPQSIGLPDTIDISKPVTFPLGSIGARAYGTEITLKKAGVAQFGLFGFCNELLDFFKNSNFPITDFLNKDLNILMDSGKETYWGEIVKKGWESNFQDYLRFTSGIKLFGLHYRTADTDAPVIPRRQIFGNVFGRFVVFTFWKYENGIALPYDLNKSVEQAGVEESKIKFYYDPNDDRIVNFLPPEYEEGVTGESEQKDIYKIYMSKIMSGMVPKNNFKKDGRGANQDLFFPLNFDYNGGMVHSIFGENEFKPNDGFEIDLQQDSSFTFDQFGEKWFGISNTTNNNNMEESSPIEKRIGRAYNSAAEFKEAVGYNDGKFKINGVVYVGEDLDLSEKDLDLKPEDCSGGIVLVDGNIKLGNIFRGEKVNPTKFQYYMGSFSGSQKYESWNKTDNPLYIGPDKIITFVCLKKGNESRTIDVTGNVLLGVQLVNLTGLNSDPQITWRDVYKNQEILFYGSIACNKLSVFNRLVEFGTIKKPTQDTELNAPFFIYPPVMATKDIPLAVQVMDDMRSYRLTSGAISE